MSRAQKIAVSSLLLAALLLGGLTIFLVNFDWNRAKPWLNQRISEASDRPFAINGDLTLSWHRFGAEQSGWQRWLPWPLLQAQQVTIGNPPDISSDTPMAQAREVTFAIDLLPLLAKKIVIPSLTLDTPKLALRREADGHNNWTLKPHAASAWKFELGRISINHGHVDLDDARHKLNLSADLHTLDRNQAGIYGLGWQLTGKLTGKGGQAVISGHGRAGSVLSLQDHSAPYPLDAEVKIGKTTIAITGKLTDPTQLESLDVHLKLSGASMAQLYPLTGIVLPETPPFSTAGRLYGNLQRQLWTYEKFTGTVGSSEMTGTLEYQQRQPRPKLSGKIVSQRLALVDLAPLIGADSNASKKRRDSTAVQPSDKVLPVEKFNTDRWRAIDTDIEFSGHKIVREGDLPIDNLNTNIHLKDGILSLIPLNFGVAGGNLRSDITLDGRQDPIKGRMTISARHLKLKLLLPSVEKMQASLGQINGDASLSATGNSIASLLGSANGEVKLLMNEGTISKLLLEQMGLNIGNIILAKLFGDQQVQINCVAGDFAVSKGLMQARTFLVDTKDATIDITGQIDLNKERLSLTLKPDTKNFRLFSLRSPLYVTGSFQHPKVGVDVGVVALKAGGAIALGLAAPLAALLPLINASSDTPNQCGELLKNARQKPSAPAPGKAYKGKPLPKIVTQPAQ